MDRPLTKLSTLRRNDAFRWTEPTDEDDSTPPKGGHTIYVIARVEETKAGDIYRCIPVRSTSTVDITDQMLFSDTAEIPNAIHVIDVEYIGIAHFAFHVTIQDRLTDGDTAEVEVPEGELRIVMPELAVP
jgi:hypothetical protein